MFGLAHMVSLNSRIAVTARPRGLMVMGNSSYGKAAQCGGSPAEAGRMGTCPSGRMSEAADAGGGQSAAQKMADYTAVMKAMQAQWESMLQAIGGPVASGMIPILKQMTTGFNEMGAAAIAHGDDIHKVMDAITTPMKELASTLATVAVPIAKGAQGLDDFLNSIVAFENKLNSTMHNFLKSWGIDFGGKGPLDPNAKPGGAGYDPLSSIRLHPSLKTTPSGIALSGGADNGKLAAASAMPVNLPPSSITAPLSGPATVHTGPITLTVSGQSIVAALASEISAKIEGLFRGMGSAGTNSDSGFDGREHPAMPDHFHGGGH
jgi:hypothetical protein